jgi:preprotein translocase subunit SecA
MTGSRFALLSRDYPERPNRPLSPLQAVKEQIDCWLSIGDTSRKQNTFLHQVKEQSLSLQQSLSEGETTAELILIRQRLRRGLGVTPTNSAGLTFDDATLSQTFALLQKVFNSTHGLIWRDTQLLAARAMLCGHLVEMATGEGKTYAAAIAAATVALAGVPVHVMTSNEYLAHRDAANLAPFYQALGIRCQAIAQSMSRDQRRAVYAQDIVYCTASEVMFDYLRDRLAGAGQQPLKRRLAKLQRDTSEAPVLRGLCFALIDEADSILIDDACTPFILAVQKTDPLFAGVLAQALKIARGMVKQTDFTVHQAEKRVQLTVTGQENVKRQGTQIGAGWAKSARYREELVVQALAALHCFERNVDYLVVENSVKIIDSNTGRIATGRQWSKGLHQLIEIKEDIAISHDQKTIIQLTYQRFFPRYLMLTGMSGTLLESASELKRIYDLNIQKIAPFLPSKRLRLPIAAFTDLGAMDQHLIFLLARLHRRGQPILIGADSVQETERLSQLLQSKQFTHQVLNANAHEHEAKIIASAGQRGSITIATPMAGRGTDIILGKGVAELGGLVVISCQSNASRRVARQLSGRSARQGDPGTSTCLVAVKRGLMGQLYPQMVWDLLIRLRFSESQISPWIAEMLLKIAQKSEEKRTEFQRMQMMRTDQSMEENLIFGKHEHR